MPQWNPVSYSPVLRDSTAPVLAGMQIAAQESWRDTQAGLMQRELKLKEDQILLARQRDDALRAETANWLDAKGSGDEKMAEAIGKKLLSVDPERGLKVMGSYLQMEQNIDTAKLEKAKNFYDDAGELFYGVDTQEGFGMAKRKLQALYPDYAKELDAPDFTYENLPKIKESSVLPKKYIESILNRQRILTEKARRDALEASAYKSRSIADAYQGSGGKPLTPKDRMVTELKMGKDFDALTKDYRNVKNSIEIINTAHGEIDNILERGGSLNAPSQAILVTFQKMLDAISVVRESEYARSAEGLSALGRIEGLYEKLARGGAGVTPRDLKDFVDLSNSLLSSHSKNVVDAAKREKRRADNYGLDLSNVLTPDTIELLEGSGETARASTREPERAAINPKTGEKLVLRNGKWVTP